MHRSREADTSCQHTDLTAREIGDDVESSGRSLTLKDSMFVKPTECEVCGQSKTAPAQTSSSSPSPKTALYRQNLREGMAEAFPTEQRVYANSDYFKGNETHASLLTTSEMWTREESFNNLRIEISPTSTKNDAGGIGNTALSLKYTKAPKPKADDLVSDTGPSASFLETDTLLDCTGKKIKNEACEIDAVPLPVPSHFNESKEGGNGLEASSQPAKESHGNELMKRYMKVADDAIDLLAQLDNNHPEYDSPFVDRTDEFETEGGNGLPKKEMASGQDSGHAEFHPNTFLAASTGSKSEDVSGHFLFEATQQPGTDSEVNGETAPRKQSFAGGTQIIGNPTSVSNKCGACNQSMKSTESKDIMMVFSCGTRHAEKKRLRTILAVADVVLKDEYRNPNILPCVVQDGVEYIILECDDVEYESLKLAACNYKSDEKSDGSRNNRNVKKDPVLKHDHDQIVSSPYREQVNYSPWLANCDHNTTENEKDVRDDCDIRLVPHKIAARQNPWHLLGSSRRDVAFDNTVPTGKGSYSAFHVELKNEEVATPGHYVAATEGAAWLDKHYAAGHPQASDMRKLSARDSLAESAPTHPFGRNRLCYDLNMSKNIGPNRQPFKLNANVGHPDLDAPSTSFGGDSWLAAGETTPTASQGKTTRYKVPGEQKN